MNKLIQLWFDEVTCFIDKDTFDVYSAKRKLLKGLKHARTPVPYFIIQYQGKKSTKSLNQLKVLLNEKLQREDSKVS